MRLRTSVLVALAACGSSQKTTEKPKPVEFTLVVGGDVTRADGKHESVAAANVLHSGDRMVLNVRATNSADLFVAYCDSKATQQVYGPVALSPGLDVRIPANGSFVVDENRGIEHVFVIASSQPLASSDPKLDAILRSKAEKQPCTQRLELSTEASRKAETEEDVVAAIPQPTEPLRGIQLPEPDPEPTVPAVGSGALPLKQVVVAQRRVPNKRRARGFRVEQDNGAVASTRSDASGIAIWAATFKHE